MIERALVEFLLSAVSVMLVAQFLPGIKAKSFVSALWFVLVVSVLNVLFGILLFPIKWMAGPILRFFGRGFIFVTAAKFSSGIEVDGCIMASVGALLVSVITQSVSYFLFHY
ncbi:MAG: phage holin family protein [Polyangiales bacterium]